MRKIISIIVLGFLIQSLTAQSIVKIKPRFYKGLDGGKMVEYTQVRFFWIYKPTPYEKILMPHFAKHKSDSLLLLDYGITYNYLQNSNDNGGVKSTNYYLDTETPLEVTFENNQSITIYPREKFETIKRATIARQLTNLSDQQNVTLGAQVYYKMPPDVLELFQSQKVKNIKAYVKLDSDLLYLLFDLDLDSKKAGKTQKMAVKFNKIVL